MQKTTLTILTLTSALALSGCISGSRAPNANATEGAMAGAVIGGIAGALTGDNRNEAIGGAIAGAVVGAAVGGIGGTILDQQAAELQAQVGGGVTVTNMGDYLVVNMPQDLLFATDSAALRPDLMSSLQAVAASLNTYRDSRVQVLGHTDNTGTAAYNMDLSQRRASTVASSLISYGVTGSRVQAIGRGEDQPIASNLTPEGRALNRRVEILIIPTT